MKKTILICGLSILSFLSSSAQQNRKYIPLEIQKAYDNQTRQPDGRPGVNYWQNKSEYVISVSIDTAAGKLVGSEQIQFYNNSPDALDAIVIRMYQDIYKKGSPRDFDFEVEDINEGMIITRFAVNDMEVDVNGFERYGTNLFVPLSDELEAGEKLKISIDWNYKFPEKDPWRGGRYENNTYFAYSWYPQIAVYDDIDGWDEFEHKGTIELYNDFSDFDVNIEVPNGFVVWSTGVLENPQSVLSKPYLEKYNSALASDQIVSIIDSTDLLAGGITSNRSTNSWHFKAKNITDFAFGTSSNYLWDLTSVAVDKSTERRVLVGSAYSKNSTHFYQAADITRKAIDYLSNELPGIPYPFPAFTSFNGSFATEFPMMTNMQDYNRAGMPVFYHTLVHEITHSYFPFYVGTNERKYAFMDEGWAQMIPMEFQTREIGKLAEMYDARANNNKVYERSAGKEKYDRPPASLTVNVDFNNYHNVNYDRPGAAYYFLQDLLGKEQFKKALQEFISRWNGKHPTPYDFYRTFDDVVGEDMSWFWNPWFFEFGYPDLSIQSFEEIDGLRKLTIKKKGNIPIPIKLRVTFTDGTDDVHHEAAGIWNKGNNTHLISIPGDKQIYSIELGDQLIIPDVNIGDNFYYTGLEMEDKNKESNTSQNPDEELDSTLLSKLDITLVEIEGGSFEMGRNKTKHLVSLDSYYMSATEVTFEQYNEYCEATGKNKPVDAKNWSGKDMPVINVTSDDAMGFCEWLSNKTGLKFRLPTEAEWEYAARERGKDQLFGNGEQIASSETINFNAAKKERKQKENYVVGEFRGEPLPVGSFPPNSLGLYDMSGNVAEWCSDWYQDDYHKVGPTKNPKGGKPGVSAYAPEHRIMRGGSWSSTVRGISTYGRGVWTYTATNDWLGFRIVREK